MTRQRQMTIGSQEHKELLCQFFLDTHLSFDPAAIQWPDLDEASLAQLRSLPFWAEAIATEHLSTCKIQAMVSCEPDALLREAIALQGYEEARHAAILQGLTAHYGIPLPPQPDPQPPDNAPWAFMCVGYSECFDAFFTFALFAMARDSGFFPPALVEHFEPVMQEEARHILFFVNWEAYHWARQPLWQRPQHLWRGVWGRSLQVWYRVQMARGAREAQNFTLGGHQTLAVGITPRGFLELCLQENERRLSVYDARLLRPRLMPTLARALCKVLR